MNAKEAIECYLEGLEKDRKPLESLPEIDIVTVAV